MSNASILAEGPVAIQVAVAALRDARRDVVGPSGLSSNHRGSRPTSKPESYAMPGAVRHLLQARKQTKIRSSERQLRSLESLAGEGPAGVGLEVRLELERFLFFGEGAVPEQ